MRILNARQLALAAAVLAAPFSLSAHAYQVSFTDCAGGTWNAGTQTLTCGTQQPPPPDTPSGCTVTANGAPGSISLPVGGGQVSIAASCATVPATSWSWTGGFMAGTGLATNTGAVAATTIFTGTPSNANGAGTPVSVTVSVATGGGDPQPGPEACPGFNSTRNVKMNWSAVAAGGSFSAKTASYGSFGGNDIVVVQFTTPAGTATQLGSFSSSESGGEAVPRTATLSTTKCDFGGLITSYATSPTLPFSVGPNSVGYPALQPNTTYYINIKNDQFGSKTCFASSCDMNLTVKKPRGL